MLLTQNTNTLMTFDLIILTPSPSFYKTKLFNEIGKELSIFVIFTNTLSSSRNSDFYNGSIHFQSTTLPQSFFQRIKLLYKILSTTNYNRLLVSGWNNTSLWFSVLYSKKQKNGCIIESSILESKTSGGIGLLKRLFLKRISTVYASGIPQEELARKLNFHGKIIKFGGCGILNYNSQPPFSERTVVHNFLYVGRLSPEKNLKLLITAFNKTPDLHLDIIGFGPLEEELKSIANKNITFLGAVNNKDLAKYYQNADVFILPSKSEVWGLVVEEALNNGTPVIVSDKVGCHYDLVTANTGLVFKSENLESLQEQISKICSINFYNNLRRGISQLDFFKRAQNQVKAFVSGE